MFGLGGGASGTGISGPQGTNLINTTNAGQVNQAYNGAQNALGQQQSLLAALQAQNGLGNQSNVYGQLQGIAAGTGPNPAQTMLNQATGQNVANTAALQAGQRGASQNVGLIARQAGQQGAATQQQAVGQAATMQANQSLNAIGQAGSIANTQAANQIGSTQALNAAAQGEQANILGAGSNLNSANVGMQANMNSVNGQLANTGMQGQQNLIGGAIGGVGTALGLAKGGVVRMADGGSPSLGANTQLPVPTLAPLQGATASTTNPSGPKSAAGQHLSSLSSTPAQGMSGAGNTLGNGIGKAIGSLFSSGKSAPGSDNTASPTATTADWAAYAGAPGTSEEDQEASMNQTGGSNNFAKGGKVPALVSPGEKVIPKHEVAKVAQGKKDAMEAGKTVPGKARVKGAKNTEVNDTVPATLNEGDIVLPRSVTQSKNPHWAAHSFVSAIMKRKGLPTRKAKEVA
jgi:hypothetical protein